MSLDSKRGPDERLIGLGLLVAAMLLRLPGLGRWCMAVDEYFLARSIGFIIERGVPEFATGGYYVRGLLLQYLSVPLVALLDNTELAVRLLPALFGSLTVPLLYYLARRYLDRGPSLVVAALLLISSWQIEFSRFARMYSMFQFVFLFFLLAVHLGHIEDRRRWRRVALTVALIAPFVYAAAVFMPLFLLVLLLRDEHPGRPRGLRRIAEALGLLLINFVWRSRDFRDMGVSDRLPEDLVDPGLGGTALELPALRLWRDAVGSSPGLILWLVLVVLAVAVLFRTSRARPAVWEWTAAGLAAALPLLHQYGLLAFLLVLIAIARPQTLRVFRGAAAPWALYGAVGLALWLVFGLRAEFLRGAPLAWIRTVAAQLVEYAPLTEAIIAPFAGSVPWWSAVCVLILGAATLEAFRRSDFEDRDLPLLALLFSIGTVPVFKTPYFTTRYSYYYFPLIFVVAVILFVRLTRWLRDSGALGPRLARAAPLVPLVIFAMTDDVHLKQLYAVSSPEVNFRQAEFARYGRHWYLRADYETPMHYVGEHLGRGDVTVLDCTVCAAYTKPPFLNYVQRGTLRFSSISRDRGHTELWTGQPLIGSTEELLQALPPAGHGRMWLVTVGGDFTEGTFHGDRSVSRLAAEHGLSATRAFEGIDQRVEVWLLERRVAVEPAGLPAGAPPD